MTAGAGWAGRFGSPIVAREGLFRARSWTTPLVTTVFLCLLGGFALVMFRLTISDAPERLPSADDMANVAFFTAGLQLGLGLLFVPSLAGGAISGERERGTLDLLLVGRLSPRHVLWTKLLASMAFPALLLVFALPVMAAAFLYAGLDLGQLALAELLTLATGVAAASMAVMLSALPMPRAVATATAYGVIVLVLGATALATVAFDGTGAAGTTSSSVHPLLFANPFYALHALVAGRPPAGVHLGRLAQLLVFRRSGSSSWGPVVQPWQASVLIQLALSALCLRVGARFVASGGGGHRRSPARRGRQAEQPALESR